VKGSKISLDRNAAMTRVFVKDSLQKTDSPGEVIVGGTTKVNSGLDKFYLEIIDYSRDFFSKWRRVGGDKGDQRVYYAGFVKSRE